MTRSLLVILAVLTASLLISSSTQAQTGIVRERLEGELERTEEVVGRAREVVLSTSSSAAKVAYDQAVALQTQAQERFRLGAGGGNWDMALTLTLKARKLAAEAIVAGRDTQQNETALLRRIERAQEMLEQAHEALGNSDRQMLVALYESAKQNLDRAWEFYRENQYRASLKLSNQVERAAEKLLQAANRNMQSGPNFERQAENVRRFLQQVREQIADCNAADAQELVEQAEESCQRAQQMEAQDQREAALRSLQAGRELADQALRRCEGDQNLVRRHERLRLQAEQLADQIGADNPQAKTLLDQGREQLELGYRYIEQNQFEAAVAALKAAQLSLDEAQRRVQSNGR